MTPTPTAPIRPAAHAAHAAAPTTARAADAASPTAYPGVLLVSGDLPPHLDALVREALANGARLTVMTLHAPGSPTAAPIGDRPPLTAAEAAAHYRVEPATVRAWCREGRFPGAERLGKSWRIPAAAIHDRPPPAPTTAAPADSDPGVPQRPRGRRPSATKRPPADGFDRTALSAWRTTK